MPRPARELTSEELRRMFDEIRGYAAVSPPAPPAPPIEHSSASQNSAATLEEVHSLMSQGLLRYGEIEFQPNGAYLINRRLINERMMERAMNETFISSVAEEEAEVEIESINNYYISYDEYRSENDEDDEDDNMFDDTPRWKTIKPNDFPAYEIPAWSSADEREQVVDLYFKQIEYRLRWIFFREEREGFRRRSHGVQPFSRQDFLEKIAKCGVAHSLNTAESTFYDWNIGATDFILRFENFAVDGIDAMRIHFVYKSNRLEVGYQDRIWDGHYYQEVSQQWATAE